MKWKSNERNSVLTKVSDKWMIVFSDFHKSWIHLDKTKKWICEHVILVENHFIFAFSSETFVHMDFFPRFILHFVPFNICLFHFVQFLHIMNNICLSSIRCVLSWQLWIECVSYPWNPQKKYLLKTQRYSFFLSFSF